MDQRIAPSSATFDSHEAGIAQARASLFEKGITQMAYPTKYGGLGLPFGVFEMAMELVGTADASIALSVGIHNTVAEGLLHFGSEGIREAFVPDIISGRRLASFSLTEPTSGSDAKAMSTKAKRVGNDYLLNGSKTFITNAGEADVYFVFAVTENGPSAFVVEKKSPGIHFGSDLPKLGMRGSRTAEVRFADCRVPKEMLVGEEGKGFEYAKTMLNASRIVMGSICVGIAQAAFDQAVAYSKERKAFGAPIAEFQLTREKIADMKTGITAGRLMCLHASRLRESREDYSSEASQAKVLATEMSLKVCDAAIQIFGGHGYTTDDIHRHWRDARLLTIGEGTSEVLRMLIARRELARSV
ncbi:MAG: acyl-CoA dehydrogenase family protein [Nitrososphaerota archaeon]|nr:acyl-CoA dehydrogenase family protein [Nitrososphaerota archaeon]